MKIKLWRGLVSALLAFVLLLGVGALPLEGLLVDVFAAEPTPYIVVEDCDDKEAYSSCVADFADKMQGAGSVSTAIDGTKTIENTTSFKIEATADMLSGWYLECWLYVDKVNNLQLRDSTIGIYQTSSNKAEIALNKLSPALKNGWNKVRVKLSNLTYTKKNDFNTINRVYLSIKTTRNTVFKLDDVCLIAGAAAGDMSGLEAAIAAGDALAATDLSGYDAANVEKFQAALAAAKTRLTDCSQRDVDVAETNLKNTMNAFGMEGYTADDEALAAYIDFNTKTYKDIDRFAILNADGSTGGLTAEPVAGKQAAAVGGKLLLAVNDEYIAATDAKVRVTYTYYDGEAGSLTMAYNGADNAATATETVTLANSTFWKRKSVKVSDAAFTEAIDGGFDLQITLEGADVAYITRVEVKLVTDSDVTEKDPPKFPAMTDINNFEDKSVAGYQMWFTASPGQSGWVHWAGGNIPSNDRISFEMWPDISEYPSSVLENTAFNNLGDGRPAQLFTSVKPETVDLHVSWMQDAGLDGFAIQRFYGKYNSGTERDYLNLVLARDAAEKYDRVFYVMYDMNGGLGDGNYAAEVLKSDFVRNVEQQGIIESTSYAQMDGKPVVCMWGIDPGSDSYTNHDATLEFICWLQDRGYYVVGGTSKNDWYNSNSFDDVYRQLDMISPWTVGRYSYNGVADWMRNSYTPTIAECEKYGIEFQPVVIAGGSWHNYNWGMPNDQPHLAGNFLWRQIYL
ncbi:MAG: hypothetical protein J6R77_05480, partial [Clostridia bacterium]|nr:hypothetical protein [Clostridia bacterium]